MLYIVQHVWRKLYIIYMIGHIVNRLEGIRYVIYSIQVRRDTMCYVQYIGQTQTIHYIYDRSYSKQVRRDTLCYIQKKSLDHIVCRLEGIRFVTYSIQVRTYSMQVRRDTKCYIQIQYIGQKGYDMLYIVYRLEGILCVMCSIQARPKLYIIYIIGHIVNRLEGIRYVIYRKKVRTYSIQVRRDTMCYIQYVGQNIQYVGQKGYEMLYIDIVCRLEGIRNVVYRYSIQVRRDTKCYIQIQYIGQKGQEMLYIDIVYRLEGIGNVIYRYSIQVRPKLYHNGADL